MSFIRIVFIAVVLALAGISAHAEDPAQSAKSAAAGRALEKCEHGVKKSICTRCNPKLEAVFKAKNDWCPEHARPESQCVICHPDLARQGVK